MKRSEALRIIRRVAKNRGIDVVVDTRAGKGSHVKVYVGARRTVIPRQVSRPLLRAILKQLRLDEEET